MIPIRSFFSNFLKLTSFTYSSALVTFLGSMVISRFLSPEEYGTVAMVMVFTGFLAFFNDAGISYVLIREKLDAEQIDFIDNASYLIGLVISLLILVLAYPISVFYEIPELVYPTIVLSVINFLGILAIVPTALVKKNSQFKTLGAIMLISNLFGTFVAISMAYLGFSFWSLILGNLSSTLISAFTFRIHSNLNFINFSLSKAKKGYVLLKDTVSNIAATRFVKYWGNKFDNLIIGKVFSSRDLGIYNRGFQIATLQMNFLSGAMNTIVLPELNRITTRKEQNGYFDFSILFVSLIQAPIIIIILFFPLQLVEFLWGSKWIEVANIIPYFAIFSLFYIPINSLGPMYVVHKAERIIRKSASITTPIFIILLVFISFFGFGNFVAFFVLSYMVIIFPIEVYFSYRKTFEYSTLRILKIWLGTYLFGLASWAIFYFKLSSNLLLLASILFIINLMFSSIKTGIKMLNNT